MKDLDSPNKWTIGTPVYHGVVRGVFLGVYNESALFMADESRHCLLSWKDLIENNLVYAKVLNHFIGEFFGGNAYGELLCQPRFAIKPIGELKLATDIVYTYQSLIKKRHLYFTMAKHYIRKKSSSEASIQRVFQFIDDLQVEIELKEARARSHLSTINNQ